MANSQLPKYRPLYIVTHTKADTTEQGISSRFIDISTRLSAAISAISTVSATVIVADLQLAIWESTDTIAWESGALLIWETLA